MQMVALGLKSRALLFRPIKQEATNSLTEEEHIVLAVEALEREVNNGGYDQFFTNSSREFVSTIVCSLRGIGCKKTSNITQRICWGGI
jgi:hypothetical protein